MSFEGFKPVSYVGCYLVDSYFGGVEGCNSSGLFSLSFLQLPLRYYL